MTLGGFAIVIKVELTERGNIDYRLRMDNNGVPEEVALTMVRHWLRNAENEYHSRFLNTN